MSLKNIPIGPNVEASVNVVVEIPAHSAPVKYEVDKDTGALYVDRFLNTAMYYPCNYGYVPDTLSEDGDPVDVLVVTPAKLMAGSVIPCRPIGMLRMTDEKGEDAKVLAVPSKKLTTLYDNVDHYEDLPKELINSIRHFFEHYKDLEEGKWVKIDGWEGKDAAITEIKDSIDRFNKS